MKAYFALGLFALPIIAFTTIKKPKQVTENAIPPEACSFTNTSFKSGEKLNYKAFYSVSGIYVAAGELELSTKLTTYGGKPAYQIVGNGKTLTSYDFLFKVRDVYTSYIDTATLFPMRFERDVQEGSYVKKQKATFKQAERKIITESETYKTSTCTLDVLSALYACRNIDVTKYKVGDKITFNLFIDDEQFSMYVKYLGKEKITTKFGTYNAIKMRPLLIKGNVFNGGEGMTMWVTDDKNHIPVRIESPIKVGSVKIDLTTATGLLNPMTAKLK